MLLKPTLQFKSTNMVENCTKKKKRWMASALEALTFEADINGDIPFKTLCRAPRRRRRRWKTSVCKKSDIVRTKTMCLYHISNKRSGENNDDDDEPGQDVCMVYQIIPTTISTVADMFWFEIFI